MLLQTMDKREGEKNIYKIIEAREKNGKDLTS